MQPLTFAVATNSRETLERNLLASPLFHEGHPHQILVQEGFSSAGLRLLSVFEKQVEGFVTDLHDMHSGDEI
jgi:hypothetical protein